MACLIGYLVDVIAAFQCVGTEEVPQRVRGNGIGVCIKDPIDLSPGQVFTVPPGEEVKPLALSELPKEEWVCHILEESGATFVSLEDFYEPYGKALRRDLIWRIPYGCLDFSGCVLCLVQEGILCLPYDAVDSQEYELFKIESERLLTKESLLELLQEFNEQTASLATVLMEMGKLV